MRGYAITVSMEIACNQLVVKDSFMIYWLLLEFCKRTSCGEYTLFVT